MSQTPPLPPPPPGSPPPPPPPPPPGAASGGIAFNVGDAISYGWGAYWKNIGPMAAVTGVIIGVQLVIGIVSNATDSAVANIVLQIISFLVGIILTMGLIRAVLAVCEGREVSVSVFTETDGFWRYAGAYLLYALGTIIGLILLIVPGIIFAVVFFYFGYAIVQQPELGVFDALKRSADITRGYRWQLFGLAILLILINFVGLLACCVGLFFTYGITAVATAYSYKTLSGQPVARV